MRKLLVFSLIAAAAAVMGPESGFFAILKSGARIGRQSTGSYLLPTNQLLRPWGEQAVIKGRPVDLAFDSRKRLLAILNSHSVSVMGRGPGGGEHSAEE